MRPGHGVADATDCLVAWRRAREGKPLTQAAPTTPERITNGSVVTYALPSLGTGAMFGMLLLYFMKFSTDVLLIAPGVIGAILGLSRIWDAVVDPIAGYWSDRTRSRYGRRRPWIFLAAVPTGLTFFALWYPPSWLGPNGLIVWMSIFALLFFTAYTLYFIPYRALGAELGAGYHDRTRVFAASALFGYFGAFAAIGAIFGMERVEDPRTLAAWLVAAMALFTIAAMMYTAVVSTEKPEYQARGSTEGYGAFRSVLQNHHARPLLIVHFLSDLGGASFASLMPYVSDYILHTPGYTAYYQLALLVGLTIGVPSWVPISMRLGKRGAWYLATALQLPLCLGYAFLRPGDAIPLVFGMFLIGFLNGAPAALAQSMQTDVIDYDELRTGERKEGVYFATWNFLQKTAVGFNVVVVGLILQFSGFAPNVVQSDPARWAIAFGFVGLPFVSMLAILYYLRHFTLDEKEHRKVLDALHKRATTAAQS